jgi:hypothetical protein
VRRTSRLPGRRGSERHAGMVTLPSPVVSACLTFSTQVLDGDSGQPVPVDTARVAAEHNQRGRLFGSDWVEIHGAETCERIARTQPARYRVGHTEVSCEPVKGRARLINGGLVVLDGQTGEQLRTLESLTYVTALAVYCAEEGDVRHPRVVAANVEGRLRVYDPEGPRLRPLRLLETQGHTEATNGLASWITASEPCRPLLASAGRGRTVQVWEPEEGSLLKILPHDGPCDCLASASLPPYHRPRPPGLGVRGGRPGADLGPVGPGAFA